MKLILVEEGMAFPEEDTGYAVDTTELYNENVDKVIWPDDPSSGPWIEKVPFEGRERPSDLLSIAETLMEEAITLHNTPPPEPEPTLDEARNEKYREISSAYDSDMSVMVTTYSNKERESWSKQESEARAWLEDNTNPTPFLDSMLSVRTTLTKEELVNRVIAKADALATETGKLTGKKHLLEEQIEDAYQADDIIAIQNIKW